jgi:hypothetical protein
MIETTSFGVRTGKYLPERSSCLDMGGSRSRPCRDAEDRMLHLVHGTFLWRSIDQAPLFEAVFNGWKTSSCIDGQSSILIRGIQQDNLVPLGSGPQKRVLPF